MIRYRSAASARMAFVLIGLLLVVYGAASAAPRATLCTPHLAPLVVSDQTETVPGVSAVLKVTDWQDPFLGPENLAVSPLAQGCDGVEIQSRLAMDIDGDGVVDEVSETTVGVGDALMIALGSKTGYVDHGLDDRLSYSAYDDYSYLQWQVDGCPKDARVIIFPIIEDTDINGRIEMAVVGFVSFYISRYDQLAHELHGYWLASPAPPTCLRANRYIISTLKADWIPSDPTEGAAQYEYSISEQYSDNIVVDWTSAGTTCAVTRAGLSLLPHDSYLLHVRAKNAWGDCSAPAVSEPIEAVLSFSPGAVKWGDPTLLSGLASVVVTAKFGDVFYVQDTKLRCAIAVRSNVLSADVGDVVDVIGYPSYGWDEPMIDLCEIVPISKNGCALPTAMAIHSIGGSDLNYAPYGDVSGRGAGNVGLLVRTWGRLARPESLPHNEFMIDDGSGQPILCVAPDALDSDVDWTYAVVTGISSRYHNDGVKPMLRIRDQLEIVPVCPGSP